MPGREQQRSEQCQWQPRGFTLCCRGDPDLAVGEARISRQNGRAANFYPDLEGLHPGFPILNGGDVIAVEVERDC
jgi:hypothetical protein